MRLEQTDIKDLYLLHRDVHKDARGIFSRLYAFDEMKKLGKLTVAVHVNSSTSLLAATLRGIHFQYPPHSETKIVSCVAGAIWDVAVDLRPDSPTRFNWVGKKLTPSNGLSLIVPEGFGHAFLTLEPNTTVLYVASAAYSADYESGIRFDDPKLGITWPITPQVISQKDKSWELIENRMPEITSKFL